MSQGRRLKDSVTPPETATHLIAARFITVVKFTAKVQQVFNPKTTASEIWTDGGAEIFSTCNKEETLTKCTHTTRVEARFSLE